VTNRQTDRQTDRETNKQTLLKTMPRLAKLGRFDTIPALDGRTDGQHDDS